MIGAVNLAGAIESEDRSPSFRNLLARRIAFSRISSYSSFCPARFIAPIGRLPKTLPEPIKRARILGLCGFAGEGNVVEWSERYASEAKPEEP